MKLDNLKQIIKEELERYFKSNPYSLEDELIIENEIMLGELLNPDNSYPYINEGKGIWSYKDMNDVKFIVRLTYQPTSTPYLEFKTGWTNPEGKIQYEPSIPPVSPNSSAIDWDKRSDTVAKIYRDEVLPFFKQQNLTNFMVIKPISSSRMKFAERLVKKFTPNEFKVEFKDREIQITK
jgi:hypothetical protein